MQLKNKDGAADTTENESQHCQVNENESFINEYVLEDGDEIPSSTIYQISIREATFTVRRSQS